MKPEAFLEKLAKEDFPVPVLVEREVGGFLDLHSHPYEVQALVTEGQIDITMGTFSKTFYILTNSTRRLFAFPSGVLLSDMGLDSP